MVMFCFFFPVINTAALSGLVIFYDPGEIELLLVAVVIVC